MPAKNRLPTASGMRNESASEAPGAGSTVDAFDTAAGVQGMQAAARPAGARWNPGEDGLGEARMVEPIDPRQRQGAAVAGGAVLDRADQVSAARDDAPGRTRERGVDQDRIG